jgi:hypothetical protein
MSRKFYAVNKETGARWSPDSTNGNRQYLMMYDSGRLAVVEESEFNGDYIKPLDHRIWQTKLQSVEVNVPKTCPGCGGKGRIWDSGYIGFGGGCGRSL